MHVGIIRKRISEWCEKRTRERKNVTCLRRFPRTDVHIIILEEPKTGNYNIIEIAIMRTRV